jgi:hypothetical protein
MHRRKHRLATGCAVRTNSSSWRSFSLAEALVSSRRQHDAGAGGFPERHSLTVASIFAIGNMIAETGTRPE